MTGLAMCRSTPACSRGFYLPTRPWREKLSRWCISDGIRKHTQHAPMPRAHVMRIMRMLRARVVVDTCSGLYVCVCAR